MLDRSPAARERASAHLKHGDGSEKGRVDLRRGFPIFSAPMDRNFTCLVASQRRARARAAP